MPLNFIIYLVMMFWKIDKGLKFSKNMTVVCPPHTKHETSLNMPMHKYFLVIIYPFLILSFLIFEV